jgi:hypothetical protein
MMFSDDSGPKNAKNQQKKQKNFCLPLFLTLFGQKWVFCVKKSHF